VELRDITLDDLWLWKRLRCDPAMMEHLGGPLPCDGIEDKLRRDVEAAHSGREWNFKIMDSDDHDQAAGHVCIWNSSFRSEALAEIGWMVLPEYQGKGLATRAARVLLDRAGDEGRWGVVHAFPAVSNAASNAICSRLGFTMVEEVDLDWAGRALRCRHWLIDLRRPAE